MSTATIRGEGGSEKSPGGHLVSLSALGTFHLHQKYSRKESPTVNRSFLSGDCFPLTGPRWKENGQLDLEMRCNMQPPPCT